MATKLPVQGAQIGKYWSLARDTQLRTVLETLFEALFGHGVVSGGLVTQAGDYVVEVEAGTTLMALGVTSSLATAVQRTVTGPGTRYLWADIVRTSASQDSMNALDTYTVDVLVTTTNAPPGATYTHLATIVVGAAGIESITNDVAGKMISLDAFAVASDSRKVLVDSGDEEGYLETKLVAGAGLSIAKSAGPQKTLTLTVTAADAHDVKGSAADTVPGTLLAKLAAGDGITLAEVDGGAAGKQIRITAGAGTFSGKFLISSDDLGAGYAEQKFVAGDGIAIEVVNAGASEVLRIRATGVPEGGEFEVTAVTETVNLDLQPGETQEVVWTHSSLATFSHPTYATARVNSLPAGAQVRITPIAYTARGDQTTGAQQCYLVERLA